MQFDPSPINISEEREQWSDFFSHIIMTYKKCNPLLSVKKEPATSYSGNMGL
jgi:hypothetical protein